VPGRLAGPVAWFTSIYLHFGTAPEERLGLDITIFRRVLE
jgi:hypothetical protein